jgi:hypothetical protein
VGGSRSEAQGFLKVAIGRERADEIKVERLSPVT